MASIQVLYDGNNGIWGPDTSTSSTADFANMLTIQGMTPDLTVIVQIKLDNNSDWGDFQVIDTTVPKAILSYSPPCLFSRVIGLSLACRVIAQR